MRLSTIAKRDGEETGEGPQVVEAPARGRQTNPAWKRKTAALARWLHIYLSMASFAILFFFAVTGLTLNHQQWFAKQQRTVQAKGQMDKSWLRTADKGVDKLRVAEYLRASHKLGGAVSDFRVDDSQVSVSFKGPGYAADVFADRDTGAYDVTETKMGMAAVWNDLHKGRDSGKVWSWIIDVSAVLMTFVSATGLVLLCFLQKRRFSGLLAAAVGCGLCWVLYVMWVP